VLNKKLILRWSARLLMACAVTLLAYTGFVLTDAWIFQKAEGRQFDRLAAASPVLHASLPASATGGLLGRMEIPRLGISVIVMEGTGSSTLRHAAGHIPGTALPGQPGNVGISAHRDTFFRPLRNVQKDDIITLTTILGAYRYRVVSARVVGPEDVSVLEPGETESLTLVTCYPFYFVGPAPKRFIVRAEMVAS
jgi:sortase A